MFRTAPRGRVFSVAGRRCVFCGAGTGTGQTHTQLYKHTATYPTQQCFVRPHVVEYFQWPAGGVYSVVQVLVQAKQPLLLRLGQVGRLPLRAGVLGRAPRLVQEVPQTGDPALLNAVARLLEGIGDRLEGVVLYQSLEEKINCGLYGGAVTQ